MAENKSIRSPLANVVPGAADLPRAPAKPAPGWGDREAYDPVALSYGLGTGIRNTLQGIAELPGTAADLFKGFLQRTRELSPVELRGSAPAMDTSTYDAARSAVQGAAADPLEAARQIRDSLVDYVKQGVATPASTAQFIGENVNPFPSARVPKPGPVLGVIKEKGGNWIRAPRHENLLVEAAALESAKDLKGNADSANIQHQYETRLEALGVPKETAPIMAPLYNESPEGAVRFLTKQHEIDRLLIEDAVSKLFKGYPIRPQQAYTPPSPNIVQDWANKRLVSYMKSEMGTKEDPLRALAEKNITHWPIDTKDQVILKNLGKRSALEDLRNPLFDRKPTGDAPLALAWDRAADNSIHPGSVKEVFSRAARLELEDPEQVTRALVGQNAIDLDQSSRSHIPRVYSVRKVYPGAFDDALEPQFEHLIDELTSSVDPNSNLPPHLKLKPEQLKGLSVPDAVKLVHKINKWRREESKRANMEKADNPATFLYKEYPEQGYKWVRLGNPDRNDPRVLANPDKDFLKEAYDYEGSMMGHCVGSYCEDARAGRSENFSLRDSEGGSHVTLEAVPSGVAGIKPFEIVPVNIVTGKPLEGLDPTLSGKTIKQIKGKANASPVDRYLWMARDFVNSSLIYDLDPYAAHDIRVTQSPLFKRHVLRDSAGRENPIKPDPEDVLVYNALVPGGMVSAKKDQVARAFEPKVADAVRADQAVYDAVKDALRAPFGSWEFDDRIRKLLDTQKSSDWAGYSIPYSARTLEKENREQFFSGNADLDPNTTYGDRFKAMRRSMLNYTAGMSMIDDPNPKRYIPYEDLQWAVLRTISKNPALMPYINDAIEWMKKDAQAQPPSPQGFAEGGEVRADEQKSPMASQVGGLRELLEGMNEDAQRMEARRKPRSNRQVEEDRRGQELGRGTLFSGSLMQPTLATEGPLMVQRFAEGGAVNSPVEAARQIRDSLVEYARQGVPSALSTDRFIASRARAKS